MALRERELALKEREGSLFKSPIVVSAIAVFVGLFSNAVSDWITKDRRLAEETRQREAALLVKAFEHNDPNVVMAKLNLLNLTGMISDANELAKKLAGQEYTEIESKIKSLPSEIASTVSGGVDPKGDRERRPRQGAEEAEAPGRGQPHSRLRQGSQSLCNAQHDGRASCDAIDIAGGVPASVAGAPTSTAVSASTPAADHADNRCADTPTTAAPTATTPTGSGTQAATCATATKSSEGWIFLGGIDGSLKQWVVSDSGTRSIEFESPELNAGPGFKVEEPLTQAVKGQCLHTKTAKFLRGDGIDGRRLQSAIKQTLPSGTRLRVVGIDSLGRDDASSARNPVLWARVEVLADD